MIKSYSNVIRIRNLISAFIIIFFVSCNYNSSDKDFYTGDVTKPSSKGSFEGYVVNTEDHSPVSNAAISLSNGLSILSDSEGHYCFTDLKAGEIRVTIKAENYLLFVKQIYIYKNQNLEIDFRLTPVPGPGVTVTVATFNVKNFALDETYRNTAKFIKDQNIDIIVFQEIQRHDEIELKTELVNNDVTMPYVEFNKEWYRDNISVWSKYSILDSEPIIRGNYEDPVSGEIVNVPRYIFRFKAKIDEQDIWFYGCHLKALSGDVNIKKRRAQAYALEKYIKSKHDEEKENIIIIGDMNVIESEEFEDEGTLGYLMLKSDNPENADNDFRAVNYSELPSDDYTYVNEFLGYYSVLDHIIISPSLEDNYINNSIDVVYPEGDPSDHYPVLLKLYFEL